MLCGLGEEERTKIRKKKKEKKEMNLIVATRLKVGRLGWKGILRHTTIWNIFGST